MPAAFEYAPDDKDLRDEATKELGIRRTASQHYWAYYLGQHRKHLKPQKGVDNNVVINLSKQIVDRTVSFLLPKFPAMQLVYPDDQLQEDTSQEKWLKQAWMANGGPRLLAKVVKAGCVDGHIFTRVIPPTVAGGYPRIVNLNAANVLCFWRADDYETILWYELHWSVGKKQYRQDVVNLGGTQLRDLGDGTFVEYGPWGIYQYVQEGDKSDWQLTLESSWNYPLGPIVDWQHQPMPNNYYGMSELGHTALNDGVNKIASDMAQIVRFHASPKTIGTGFVGNKLQATSVDGFWTIENENAKVYNLEMHSELQASKEVAQKLEDAFLAESRVVVMKGNIADFQRVTNLGVRTVFMEPLSKNDELGWQYGYGIEAISQRMRMLNGVADYGIPVKTTFADPIPQDLLEETTALEKQRGMGVVSKHTTAEKLDYNWKEEQERIDEEGSTDAGLMERVLTG